MFTKFYNLRANRKDLRDKVTWKTIENKSLNIFLINNRSSEIKAYCQYVNESGNISLLLCINSYFYCFNEYFKFYVAVLRYLWEIPKQYTVREVRKREPKRTFNYLNQINYLNLIWKIIELKIIKCWLAINLFSFFILF